MKLEVIPQPQKVTAMGAGFALSKSKLIRVSDTAEDRFSAAQLRDALRETHGIDCDIITLAPNAGRAHELVLIADALPSTPVPSVPAGKEDEGYGLSVDANGVSVSAKNGSGLFYGVQTLIQLAEQARRDKASIPGMTIADWPTFGLRGRYFDAAQYAGSVVPTKANIEREIKLLSRYKLNILGVELYNFVPFKSFPYCADQYTLTLSDWQYLVELAHSYHVTIMPGLQSFAQIYQVIWNCDEGKPYREETAPGMICPSRPENIEFLKGLYKNLLEVFKYTPYVGVGCSEVDIAWQKRYCPRCKQRLDAGETQYDIYYKHVSNCTKAVEAAAKELGRDVKPLMWADEFYCGYDNKRWVGIENIPKNVLMGHWQYWSRYQEMTEQKGWEKDYNGITGLLERGFDVFFVSASFEFNTYIHDLTPDEPKDGRWNVLYDAGIYNIADQAKWADVHNKEGHPGKVVGGVCATFSQHDIRGWDTTWYAFVLQGEYTWGDPTRPLVDVKKTFTDNFAATFYGARDKDAAETIAAAFGDLDAAKSDLERNNYLIRDFIGEYDIHDNFYKGNNLIKSLKLIDDLTATPQGPGKTIKDIRLRAEKAVKVARSYRSKLAALTPRVENNYSLHYLVLAAHRIENHAMRTLYMLDQQETLAKLSVAKDAQAKIKLTREINELDARLDALRRDTRVIADEMDQLAFGSVATLPRDTTGCHKVLAYLAEFKKMLDKTKGQ